MVWLHFCIPKVSRAKCQWPCSWPNFKVTGQSQIFPTMGRILNNLPYLIWYGSIFIYQRYPANSCSFWWSIFWPHPGGSATSVALQPLFPGIVFLMSLVLVHVGYLFCNWHSLNTNYYGTTLGGMPGSFNSSQINACIVGIRVLGPRFIVSTEND